VWVTVVGLQILLNDTYKLNHCKEMGAEPGRRFLIQPAAKLEPVITAYNCNLTYEFLCLSELLCRSDMDLFAFLTVI